MSDGTVRGHHPRPVGEPLPDPLDGADNGATDDADRRVELDADLPATVDGEAYASARVVVPRVVGLTGARSIVDVGCGSGAWMRAGRELGVPDVVGVDGPQVADRPRAVATTFVERDLGEPLDLDRRFNLAICVEVAGRLPAARAPGLVADLTALAPVVLFSAAVPGQTGGSQVNEQWTEHWVALFEAHGWICRDAVRPWIRTNEQVAWWYRQNLFLAVAPTADGAYSSFPKLDSIRIPNPVDYLRRPAGEAMHPPAGPARPEPASSAAPAVPEPGTGGPSAVAATARPEAADDEGAGATSPVDRPPSRETSPPFADPATTMPGEGAAQRDPAGDDDARRDADNAEFWGADVPAGPGDPGGADDVEHPKPPGWEALKRLSRRARRRHDG